MSQLSKGPTITANLRTNSRNKSNANILLKDVRLRSKTIKEVWSLLDENSIQFGKDFVEVLKSREFREMVENKGKK